MSENPFLADHIRGDRGFVLPVTAVNSPTVCIAAAGVRMAILLLTIATVFLAALWLHAYKRLGQVRTERMQENEYNTAVGVWSYAQIVKSQLEDSMRYGGGVLQFSRLAIPHMVGYRVSIELSGPQFRIYAVPDKYGRTARLSFYVDNRLTVLAGDKGGRLAGEDDPEYTGEQPA